MNGRLLPGLALVLALGVAVAALGARALERLSPGLDLSRAARFQVDDASRERLAALPHRVVLTWFATRPEDMPSHLGGLDRDVRAVLSALARASSGKLVWQVVHPDSPEPGAEGLADFAARLGVGPYTTREVRGDRWTERSVWSTLHVAYGPYTPAAIRALEPDDVWSLQGRVLAHLAQMEHPRRPVVALDAPDEFTELRAALSERAEVVEHRFALKPPIPPAADLFVWIDPARGDLPVDAREAELLERCLESGRSVVVAGGALELARDTSRAGSKPVPIGRDIDPLLAAFGVHPVPGLVLDERSLPAEDGTRLPYRVLCNAYDQDFRAFRGQPNGTLLFDLPRAFTFDAARLAELALRAEVLATTSDRTWTQPVSESDALAPERGEPAPKLPLLARLAPLDPTRGALVVAASTSPFRRFDEDGLAHRALVDVLLDDLLSNERLVAIEMPRADPERLPFLSGAARIALRSWVVLAVPAVLLALALARRARRERQAPQGTRAARRALVGPVARAGLALGGVLALAWLAAAFVPRVDLTADARNSLSPVTRRVAAAAGPLRVRRVVSAGDRLPPEVRATVREADRLLRELGRDAALRLERVEPELLPAGEREELARLGAGPVELATRSEEARSVRRFHACLVLEQDGGSDPVAIALHDPDARDELEFRIALALRSLERGRARVAFASDLPRMTAAEAWEYRSVGLFAPLGADEYAAARERLARTGFEVVHVNPRDPRLPDDVDALVWLQPRRDAAPMLAAAVDYLRRGGRLFLAAQNYRIEARAGEASSGRPSLLPRDQLPDLDLYWSAAGIRVARELVFDRGGAPDGPSSDATLAQPFVVRAPAEAFDRDAVATRSQGDLVFVTPSRIDLDPARLAELGLEARAWIATSERAWTSAWSGGELSADVLSGATAERAGSLPLVVHVAGTFPEPAAALAEGRPTRVEGEPAPGALVLVGCSEMFKDDRLRTQGARADRFLVDAVSALAVGDELASIVAGRPVARGFEPIADGERLRWRAFATACAPLLLLCVGLVRALASVLASRGARP